MNKSSQSVRSVVDQTCQINFEDYWSEWASSSSSSSPHTCSPFDKKKSNDVTRKERCVFVSLFRLKTGWSIVDDENVKWKDRNTSTFDVSSKSEQEERKIKCYQMISIAQS